MFELVGGLPVFACEQDPCTETAAVSETTGGLETDGNGLTILCVLRSYRQQNVFAHSLSALSR